MVATSAATAPAFTGCHGPGFIHHQRATQQFPAVARLNRMIGLCIVGDFDESKPTRFPAETVAHDVDAVHRYTGLTEEILEIGFGGGIGKVTYKKSHIHS